MNFGLKIPHFKKVSQNPRYIYTLHRTQDRNSPPQTLSVTHIAAWLRRRQKHVIQKGTHLLAAALDPSDQDFLDEGPEDECPEGDRGVAATVVQEERVADLEEVKDGDEEADVVHHGVGHRPVHRVRHGLREG